MKIIGAIFDLRGAVILPSVWMWCQQCGMVDRYRIIHVISYIWSQYNGIIIASVSIEYSVSIQPMQSRDKHYHSLRKKHLQQRYWVHTYYLLFGGVRERDSQRTKTVYTDPGKIHSYVYEGAISTTSITFRSNVGWELRAKIPSAAAVSDDHHKGWVNTVSDSNVRRET